MSAIEHAEWDSEKLKLKVGNLRDISGVDKKMLGEYDMVFTKLPQFPLDSIHKAEDMGFRFVGTELNLVLKESYAADASIGDFDIIEIRKQIPDFDITGFYIANSRFMLDLNCSKRLNIDFWDDMIRNHCRDFADVVFCAVNSQKKLVGFISCVQKNNHLDLFMVGVHPKYQSQGIGSKLMNSALDFAYRSGFSVSTSVFAHNHTAMNFYSSYHFCVESSSAVMHFWKDGGRD
jgi:ribosomal protein S18 acetylase RimI-like enzyme